MNRDRRNTEIFYIQICNKLMTLFKYIFNLLSTHHNNNEAKLEKIKNLRTCFYPDSCPISALPALNAPIKALTLAEFFPCACLRSFYVGCARNSLKSSFLTAKSTGERGNI